jgi:hypothetical protein
MLLNRPLFILALMMTTLPLPPRPHCRATPLTGGRLGLYDAQDFRAVVGPCVDCNAAAPQALGISIANRSSCRSATRRFRCGAGRRRMTYATGRSRAAGNPTAQYRRQSGSARRTSRSAARLDPDGTRDPFGRRHAHRLLRWCRSCPEPVLVQCRQRDLAAGTAPDAARHAGSGAIHRPHDLAGQFRHRPGCAWRRHRCDGETLATLVRADDGGAHLPASARLLWERTPGAARAHRPASRCSH